MRLWSLHPCCLDSRGLVALWREGLLAKAVLEGKTKGYKQHPQLVRFRETDAPAAAINKYLEGVYDEACRRGFNFNPEKIDLCGPQVSMAVNKGQLRFETQHLLIKLKKRDPGLFGELRNTSMCEPHPIFTVVEGGIAIWEKNNDSREHLSR